MQKWPLLAEFLQLGWVVAFSLLIPLIIGIWLDRRLQTAPLFILIGMLIGTLAATIGTVRTANRMMQQIAKSEQQKQEAQNKTDGNGAA